MVKKRFYKKSLGRRRFGKKSSYGKSSIYSYSRKKYYPKKRFFRSKASAGKRLLYKNTVPTEIPVRLYISKAIASSILSSMNAPVSDFFVNSRTLNSSDFALDPRFPAFESEHEKSLRKLNPRNLFMRDVSEYGIDSNSIDPLLNVRSTSLSFSGHVPDLISVFSLFSPMSLSYDSCKHLNRLFGLPAEHLPNLLMMFFNMPMVIGSGDPVANLMEYQLSSIMHALNPGVIPRDPAAPLGNKCSPDMVFAYDVVNPVLSSRNSLLLLFLRVFQRYCIQAPDTFLPNQYVFFDVNARSFEFKTWNIQPGDLVDYPTFTVRFDARFRLDYPAWAHYTYAVAGNARFLNQRYDLGTFTTMNSYRKALVCLSFCERDVTDAFVGFIADMFAYAAMHFAEFVIGSTILGIYVVDILNKKNMDQINFQNLNVLSNRGVMRIKKMSTSSSVMYTPKSQVNAHWVAINPGVTLKISTVFSRDYSGFMSLFKNAVKNPAVRKELSEVGKDLFRRLEPTYNLVDIQ